MCRLSNYGEMAFGRRIVGDDIIDYLLYTRDILSDGAGHIRLAFVGRPAGVQCTCSFAILLRQDLDCSFIQY